VVTEWTGWLAPQRFMAEFWQKQPLIMRGVLPQISGLLSPDELAGLSCLQGVEARLVWEKGADRAWQVEQGPFAEQQLSSLPPSGWSLLVQQVDRLVASVADLTENFLWLPNWRIDDVMVSYAGDQSGVGPHTDLYDVFLIQGQGLRDWYVSDHAILSPNLVPGLDLKILADPFAASPIRLLPGDLLYIPPNFAHHGIAIGESMTYSIGFRAPCYRDLLMDYAKSVAEQLDDAELYTDPDLTVQREPGLLAQRAIDTMQRKLHDALFTGHGFAKWLACELSKPRLANPDELQPVDLPSQPCDFRRREGCRFLYIKTGECLFLYVEGDEWQLDLQMEKPVARLCRQIRWSFAEVGEFCSSPEANELWNELLVAGYIFASEADS